ncbi:hypothetical protein PHLGIDRAFT_272032 [Phlebiopsis gigantea 11061_1 CR5-6]|uniref:HTH CENPB-type domain-containing protein n=1 Tax=Phlebiopsis gigantea (strain 11061_1 CR5-6) TaxID=745531 RepID=A0A0C3NE62_PHLG1|nr:hypothetical protein PHLGIDRAFT_272032 [Phlebiopsis gigantea 11061_1 CR5-6]
MLSFSPIANTDRSAKYPVVELPMEEWVKEQAKLGTIFTDAMIRVKALEIASGVADAKDKFKASPGWIENFKARMGIRKGVYHGDGKGVQAESILGRNVRCPTDDNAPGRRHRATIPTEYKRKANGDWPKAVIMMEEEERQYKIMIGGYVSQPVGGTDGMDGLGGLDDTDDADSMNGLEDEERGADEDWQSTSNMPHVTPTTEQHDPAHMDGSPPLAILPPNVQAQPPHVSPVEHTPSHRAPFPGDAALGHGVETAAETQIDLGAQYQEEPDYVKAIELVMGLSRRPEFKKYAELRDEDDDCLVNMVQAIKTWSRGQPHRRR